jgi:hypothetical protein
MGRQTSEEDGMKRPNITAPGLKWRPRKDRFVPYWIPRDDAVAAGYPSGSINLESFLDGTPEGELILKGRCEVLQNDMLLWLAGYRRDRSAYDGTFRSILDIYEIHEESPFHNLKPASRHPYVIYLGKLRTHIGDRMVGSVNGLDVKGWWKVWSAADKRGRPTKVAAGWMAFSVLKTALRFGATCGLEDCAKLLGMMNELSVPRPRPRNMVALADQIIAAREAAHAVGRPSLALAYAMQFETALRQWDVIGQWYPLDYDLVCDVTGPYGKWRGLDWRHIDSNLVLRLKAGKTEDTTGEDYVVDLRLCPMVMEELAHWPQEARQGPVIIDERTGLPYVPRVFESWWRRKIRKAAGLPANLWARDLRASAVTEGRRGGATTDDSSKVAAHSSPRTTALVYDREKLEAHRRFATARLQARKTHGEQD